MNEQLWFFGLLIAAILVSRTPLRAPFGWMETFFHELSHGLAAIITFGWIRRIRICFDGSGSCTTVGGMRVPILLAGYLGAVTWGALIFMAGYTVEESGGVTLLQFLMGVIVVSTVLFVRNIATFLIMAILFGIFYLPTLVPESRAAALAVEFYGLYVLQSAITAPLNLIDGKHEGDGADLADIFLILPEGVWILLWLAYGLATLFFLWQWITPVAQRLVELPV